MKNTIRNIEMKNLRNNGKSLQEIGNIFNVSRERVRQIVGNSGFDFLKEFVEKNIEVNENMTTKEAVLLFGGKCKGILKKKIRKIHHKVTGGYAEKGNEIESLVNQKLISLGYESKLMPIGYPYDIEVNNKIKIEVKASFVEVKTSSFSENLRKFSIKKRVSNCDFFICYIPDYDVFFVIPSSEVKNTSSLYITYPYLKRGWSKWRNFENKFDLLKG